MTERLTDAQFKAAEKIYDFMAQCEKRAERSDFILAAGCHDIRVAEHAARLYHEGMAPLVICAGGLGKITEGLWSEAEAVVFSKRCMELGVPESDIVLEQRSRNTGENFAFSKIRLEEEKIPAKSGIIVSKPYMARRAYAAAKKQWSGISWSSSVPELSFAQYCEEGSVYDTVNLLTGDLQRLEVYARLGFQTETFVPEAMWKEYEFLVSEGFDRFIIREKNG